MSNSKLAVPQLAAVQIEGVTRQSFILRGAVAAGAVYGMSTISPFVGRALAQEGGGDVDVLNFALTLEFLEAAFYDQAIKDVSGLDGDVKEVTEQLQKDEAEHVEALMATITDLGGTPVEAPGVDFGDAFASVDSYLELSQTFEDTGVSAYNGAAPNIESKEVLAAAGSIVQIEARHAAVIRFLREEPIAPSAFDEALEMQAVLDAVEPFVKS